jgi:Oxidoreductase family, NAD-binding Rossmann fold
MDICRIGLIGAGCRPFPGPGELLAAGVDAVYVCVPPFAHGTPETAVLSARLPLFVEKPLAATAETAERLGARVAAAGASRSRSGTAPGWLIAAVRRKRSGLQRPEVSGAGFG